VSDEEDIDGDNFASEIDCDDTQETIFPGANEIFDLLDNDCDGEVDENFRALLLYENFSIRSFESQNVIRNSKKLKTAGSLGEIFLYVEASVENPETQLTKFDSIYVYLDSGDDGGLIRRDKSFIHSKNSERTTRLLFNLKELPLSMLPYSEKGEPRILDFTTKLEQNGTHRLGAFVGSQRGGVLKKMILGHTGDGSIILEK